MPSTARRDQAGAANALVLVLAFALVIVAWGAGSVVAGVVAHRIAQNAADLAALAGAASSGCTQAAEVAQVNRARLVACEIEGEVVTVEVVVATTFGVRADLHARARAGPTPVDQ